MRFRLRFPLFYLSFIWLAGLIIGTYVPSRTAHLYWLMVIFTFVLFLLSIKVFKQKGVAWLILLGLAIFALGILRMQVYEDSHQTQFANVQEFEQQRIGIRGVIDSKPKRDGNQLQMVVKPISVLVENKEATMTSKEKFLIRFYLEKEEQIERIQGWQKGSSVRLYGIMNQPHSFHNPGLFNYEEYLAQQSIYWIVQVPTLAEIEVKQGVSYEIALNQLREQIDGKIEQLYPAPYASFMKGILIGNRDELPEQLKKDFSFLGLSHLLAISGLHLSIFTLILYGLLSRLRLSKEKIAVMTIFFVLFYMLLTGASSSVVRASVMTVLMLYGYIFQRTFHSLQALGLAFIIMTAYEPYWIFNIGFQLSFVITFFIIWGTPKLESLIPVANNAWRKSISLLIITQLASFPIVLYHFHQYTFLAWIANFAIVPVFSLFILPVGLLSLSMSIVFFPIANLLSYLLSQILSLLFAILHLGSESGLFQVVGGFNYFFEVFMLYALLIWALMRKRVKRSFIPYSRKIAIFRLEKLFLLAFVVIIVIQQLSNSTEVNVTLIDVGQGDSILIESTKGQTILIDSGGTLRFSKEEWKVSNDPFDVGKDILIPYLYYRGIETIQLAVLTHEDQDHIGGFLTLVEQVPIESFLVGAAFPSTEQGEQLKKKLEQRGIPIYYLDRITSLQLKPYLKAHFIYLDEPFLTKENDRSVISILEAHQTKLLLMADLEQRGEKVLLEKYSLASMDILKVGHHGSKTSTTEELVDAVKPKEALISVGYNNRYKHPAAEVIHRLEHAGISVYRTDQDGAIQIEITSNGYEIVPTKKVASFSK